MIILRALLNGVASLVALLVVTLGIPMLFLRCHIAMLWPTPIAWTLGYASAALVLFFMSKLQRTTLHLSVGNLIVQNLLSVGFLACYIIPMNT